MKKVLQVICCAVGSGMIGFFANRGKEVDQKAKNIANEYILLQTAGSYAHEVDAIGRGYITTYAETEHELIKQIKRKKNLVNGTPSSLWQACRSYVYSLNCIMTK